MSENRFKDIEKLENLIRDANRYRFLRDQDNWDVVMNANTDFLIESDLEDFDAVVDACMKIKKGGLNE